MAQKNGKLLTVCMPVYNGSAYIAQSIDSVLAQSYKDFQLIICDNGSTDDTPRIVKKYDDPRIRYVQNEKNLGLVGNHQRCVELAETRYVNIWHDDDIMRPDNLERKIDVLEKNPTIGLVFSNVELIDAAGREYHYRWNEECQKDYMETLPVGALFFIGTVVSRKESLLQAGGFRPSYSPLTCDSALWLRMLLQCDAACLGAPLVKYRQHKKNTTSQYYGTHFMVEHYKVFEDLLAEQPGQIPDFQTLKKGVHEKFVRQALENGVRFCGNGDFEGARDLLLWAGRIASGLVWRSDYWRLRLRLEIGPRALGLCRSVKNRLKELL
jgi:glycosyltransferase involved in cell wall biosynthesis